LALVVLESLVLVTQVRVRSSDQQQLPVVAVVALTQLHRLQFQMVLAAADHGAQLQEEQMAQLELRMPVELELEVVKLLRVVAAAELVALEVQPRLCPLQMAQVELAAQEVLLQ